MRLLPRHFRAMTCRAPAAALVLVCCATVASAQTTTGNSSTIGLSSNGTSNNATFCAIRDFQDAYDYEVRFGLFTQMQTCNDKIRKLLQLPFGPPTAWEVFNIMCKGTCREYMARTSRLEKFENMTGCSCAGTQTKCPVRAASMLCSTVEYCYDPEWFEETACDTGACGRWASNEKDYRSARQACGLYLDGAAAHTVAAASVLAVAAAAVASMFMARS